MKHSLKKIIDSEDIANRIKTLGKEISNDFKDRELTVIGVLKGSFIFMADLVREIESPLRCDFLRIESYDENGKSGHIRLVFDLTQPIEGKDVLVIEDILDTGKSLQYILHHLKPKNPKSINICCLLNKEKHPALSKEVRYTGFQIPDVYVVGYGLDLAGKYRELSYVAEVLEPAQE